MSALDGEVISFTAGCVRANLADPEMQVSCTCSKPVTLLEFHLLTD